MSGMSRLKNQEVKALASLRQHVPVFGSFKNAGPIKSDAKHQYRQRYRELYSVEIRKYPHPA